MPVIAPFQPWNTATFSAIADLVRGPIQRPQVGVRGAAVGVAQLGPRELEVRTQLDERAARAAAAPRRPRTAARRALSCGRGCVAE